MTEVLTYEEFTAKILQFWAKKTSPDVYHSRDILQISTVIL